MQLNQLFTSGKTGNLLALIAGLILPLAFAPFSIFPIAILSPAILLGLWLNVSAKQAFYRGWLFGIGMFGAGIYWVFISVHTYGNTAIPIALIITAGFIAVLALFPALTGYWLNRYFRAGVYIRTLCAFPALWVLLEWTRSWLFSGFPWLTLGYSQIHSPLKGLAPIFSVYGISLAILLSSGLIVNCVIKARQKLFHSCYYNLAFLAFIWIISGCLSLVSWTQPFGNAMQVSLIQGNIEQSTKWSADSVQPTLDHYQKLTDQSWGSKIIIWPESAVPVPFPASSDYLFALSDIVRKHDASLITGVPLKAPFIDGYYNAAMVLGTGYGVYFKHRLVPFGEYLPFKNWLQGLIGFFDIPMSDFIPGHDKPNMLLANGIKLAAFICYEIAFPDQVVGTAAKSAVLLTLTNDAWFGHSSAQAQHLEMAQMRALETGRPLLFSSNNGITAIINSNGNIQKAAPPFESYVLTDDIQPRIGRTPWMTHTLDPLLLTLMTLIMIAWIGQRSRRY